MTTSNKPSFSLWIVTRYSTTLFAHTNEICKKDDSKAWTVMQIISILMQYKAWRLYHWPSLKHTWNRTLSLLIKSEPGIKLGVHQNQYSIICGELRFCPCKGKCLWFVIFYCFPSLNSDWVLPAAGLARLRDNLKCRLMFKNYTRGFLYVIVYRIFSCNLVTTWDWTMSNGPMWLKFCTLQFLFYFVRP